MKAIFEAIIMGIIQGATEFLPVSSSGHLAIYQRLTGQELDSGLLLTALLHMGTLLAVVICFYKTIKLLLIELWHMIKDIAKRQFKWSEMNAERRTVVMMILSTLMLIPFVLPLIPGKEGMRSIKDLLDPVTKGQYVWLVGLSLLVTAALLFVSDNLTRRRRALHHVATEKDAVVIGLTQGLAAAFPGLSRSGSTTSAALISGLDKKYAAQYSFVLSIPAVLGANLLELMDALKPAEAGSAVSVNVAAIIVGIVVALVVGILAIRLFLWLLRENKYYIFAIYCAALGAIVIVTDLILTITA